MGWALSSRVAFNKSNIYHHNWHKEYQYFVFDELTTVNWQREKLPIFCIVTASIFVAEKEFVLQCSAGQHGDPAGKAGEKVLCSQSSAGSGRGQAPPNSSPTLQAAVLIYL